MNKIVIPQWLTAFVTIEISRVIVLPCLNVWLLAAYCVVVRLWLKALLTAVFLACMMFRDYTYTSKGLIRFQDRSLWACFGMWTGIWLSVAVLDRFFSYQLKKERAA